MSVIAALRAPLSAIRSSRSTDSSSTVRRAATAPSQISAPSRSAASGYSRPLMSAARSCEASDGSATTRRSSPVQWKDRSQTESPTASTREENQVTDSAGRIEESRGPRPELKIVSSRVYRGPNVWHYEPAIHLVVDLGVLEDFPTDQIPGFTEGLLARLPGLRNHSCSRGRQGGFVERLNEGTWLGHVAEHVALQLQQEVGHDMRRGKTRQVKGERGRYNVIYAYFDEGVGLAAGELAVKLVNDLVEHDPEFDFDAELEQLHRPGRAIGVRPVHPGAGGRGGQPRHPVHPAEHGLAGPARPGRPPEADPRDHDVEHVLGGGRHRQQQGADPHPAVRGRAAGPPVPVGPPRRGRGPAGQPDRLPRRGEAARRQPRSGRDAGPARRRRGPERLPGGVRRVAERLGDRRDASSPARTTAVW